jgi:hypothetical protein
LFIATAAPSMQTAKASKQSMWSSARAALSLPSLPHRVAIAAIASGKGSSGKSVGAGRLPPLWKASAKAGLLVFPKLCITFQFRQCSDFCSSRTWR